MKLFAFYFIFNHIIGENVLDSCYNKVMFIKSKNKYLIYDMILETIKDYKFSNVEDIDTFTIPMNIPGLLSFIENYNISGEFNKYGYFIPSEEIIYTILDIDDIQTPFQNMSKLLNDHISIYLKITGKLPSQLNHIDLDFIFDIKIENQGEIIFDEIIPISDDKNIPLTDKNIFIYTKQNNYTDFDVYFVTKDMSFNKFIFNNIKNDRYVHKHCSDTFKLNYLNIIDRRNINDNNLNLVKTINNSVKYINNYHKNKDYDLNKSNTYMYTQIIDKCIDKYINILYMKDIFCYDIYLIIKSYLQGNYVSDFNIDINCRCFKFNNNRYAFRNGNFLDSNYISNCIIDHRTNLRLDQTILQNKIYKLYFIIAIYLVLTHKTIDNLVEKDVDIAFKFISNNNHTLSQVKEILIINDNDKIYPEIQESMIPTKEEIDEMNYTLRHM